MWLLLRLLFCRGHKVQSLRRAVRASDVDDVRVHVPVRQACSSCVVVLRCLRVEIRMFAGPCARGMVCDAFGTEAGFSPFRCCAVLLCSILCWHWDSIPRACQACISELSILPQCEVNLSGEGQKCKK